MLGSPHVLRAPNIQIEFISFQRLCTGLTKRHGLDMLGLRHFSRAWICYGEYR